MPLIFITQTNIMLELCLVSLQQVVSRATLCKAGYLKPLMVQAIPVVAIDGLDIPLDLTGSNGYPGVI